MIKRFQILSLDGGGIKGLFAAAVLAHLEEDLKIRVIDHFDCQRSREHVVKVALYKCGRHSAPHLLRGAERRVSV